MFDFIIESFEVRIRISQNFEILSILYLYYNFNLINLNNNKQLRVVVTRFVNDITFIVISLSTFVIINNLTILVD